MKLKPLPIFVTLAALLCLVASVLLTMSGIKPKGEKGGDQVAHNNSSPVTTKLVVAQAPRVAVIKVNKGDHKAHITGYGEASAHYQITYTAEVSGRVSKLSSDFESGQLVNKGSLLAQLENTVYQQAVALAKSDLAQSQLDYLEEQRTGEQARLEWKRSGLEGEPSSELVLRQPQLTVAKTALDNAQISLLKAQQDLHKTTIKAPFNALIVTRDIQPGSYVEVGTSVASLYSTDRVEVEIPLSEKQWLNLPSITNAQLAKKKGPTWPVTLYDSQGEISWQGKVIRIQQHLDSDSRQRALIVAVDTPFKQKQPLFPGTFVQADIDGRVLSDTWELPASAISQQGDIWFVTDNNLLNKAVADKRFERGDSVYVSAIQGIDTDLIIKRPLSNYVVGMKIIPQLEE